MNEQVTFSFGKNWCDYLATISEEKRELATQDIRRWLGDIDLRGKSVLDAGSGSGIHSWAFHRLGAERVDSFDLDERSVRATTTLWEQAGRPHNWKVQQGSVVDHDFLRELGTFDIVYSWGVLHHTGSMWQAMDNVASLVKPLGLLWVSLYAKGPRYAKDLKLKRSYNAASSFGKRWMVRKWILKQMWKRACRFKNPLNWAGNLARGMNAYHDVIDWLGGLPYEVAAEDEVAKFALRHGFALEGIRVAQQGGCSIYLMRHIPQLKSQYESLPSAA